MAFVSLEIFQKKMRNTQFCLLFFFFVFLLTGSIKARSHNTLSVFDDGAIEKNLRAKL